MAEVFDDGVQQVAVNEVESRFAFHHAVVLLEFEKHRQDERDVGGEFCVGVDKTYDFRLRETEVTIVCRTSTDLCSLAD